MRLSKIKESLKKEEKKNVEPPSPGFLKCFLILCPVYRMCLFWHGEQKPTQFYLHSKLKIVFNME